MKQISRNLIVSDCQIYIIANSNLQIILIVSSNVDTNVSVLEVKIYFNYRCSLNINKCLFIIILTKQLQN